MHCSTTPVQPRLQTTAFDSRFQTVSQPYLGRSHCEGALRKVSQKTRILTCRPDRPCRSWIDCSPSMQSTLHLATGRAQCCREPCQGVLRVKRHNHAVLNANRRLQHSSLTTQLLPPRSRSQRSSTQRCSCTSEGLAKPARSRRGLIQHKEEAFWFYRFLSIVYDKVVNPGHWTIDMRTDALEPAKLQDPNLKVSFTTCILFIERSC